MEGEALGWVAVGFTKTRNMVISLSLSHTHTHTCTHAHLSNTHILQFSADVVACNRDPATGMVEVLDTYNIAEPGRGNVVDPTQDVMLVNSEFDGTRISCTLVYMEYRKPSPSPSRDKCP